jgi:long-chain acyl-CoA synthetase
MLAVPRIFEKIYDRVQKSLQQDGIKKSIFQWALDVSNTYYEKIDMDKTPSALNIINQQLAFKLVFEKLYQKFGSRIRYFISGGAPLSSEIILFLRNANLTILEGYGLTETIAPCSLNPFDRQIPGTVGKPMGDVEFRFGHDSEILIKSKAMFSGYYKNDEATQDAIKDGWFHSGDIGEFDKRGHLKITDRKKDIIITSGGKNIAPQKIENLLKLEPHITNAAIFGDKQKYIIALIIIEKDSFINDLSDLGLEKSIDLKSMAHHPKIQEIIWEEIQHTNEELARFEQIKKFYIVDTEVNTDNYLTPSLKLKKKLVFKDYEQQISELYR